MKKTLDYYVGVYQLQFAYKNAICIRIPESKVTQMICAVQKNWCHHIVLTHSLKIVTYIYLCHRDYVFARLCLFVCLFVCLCVSKITQKVMNGSLWNFLWMSGITKAI